MKNIIEESQFDDFKSFIKEISYGGTLWDALHSNCIFRGESSDKYQLIPSALRDCNKDKVLQLGHYQGKHYDSNTRVMAEYNILRQFYYACDHANLYMPSCEIRKYVFDDVSTFIHKDKIWLPDDLYEVAGLAQHYGLPTRLLDWSYDIYISLYFASIGAMKDNSKGDYMVLWGLKAKEIEVDKSIGKVIPIQFIRPSYHGNPNLGAQKGLFALWEFVRKEDRQNNQDFVPTPLDSFLKTTAKEDKTLLYKLKLPIRFAPHLYSYLNHIGYNASRVFPGYQGVSQKILEDLLFETRI